MIFLESTWQYVSRTLRIFIPFDPLIPLLGIYAKKNQFQMQKKLYAQRHLSQLFIIGKKGKQPEYSAIEEWQNILWLHLQVSH